MADSLYGTKQAFKAKHREISSSTSLAFSSNLSSLIAGSSLKPAAGRPHVSKTKPDIFSTHNKNAKKRAAADLLDGGEQKHKTEADLGGSVDAATLHRSKRRMEDKARLYAQMKRGEYHGGDKYRENGLIDFDRKWAEDQRNGGKDNDSSAESDDDGGESDEEMVDYIDEFGRARKGTKAQATREQRRQQAKIDAAREAEEISARPSMPSNIIYGDTVQQAAFNPETVIADRMADIAKKRDRSATPPPDSHFDATTEVRTKGTGFYNFSQNKEERQKEMDALEKERLATEKVRAEREAKKQERLQAIQARKQAIAEQRRKLEADNFLDNLDLEGG